MRLDFGVVNAACLKALSLFATCLNILRTLFERLFNARSKVDRSIDIAHPKTLSEMGIIVGCKNLSELNIKW